MLYIDRLKAKICRKYAELKAKEQCLKYEKSNGKRLLDFIQSEKVRKAAEESIKYDIEENLELHDIIKDEIKVLELRLKQEIKFNKKFGY